MLTAARLARNLLGEAAGSVAAFVRSRLSDSGGFTNRGGRPDLYYTLFGIESLLAVEAETPAEHIAKYLSTFSSGQSLDLVHLACLVRCWASLPGQELPAPGRPEIAPRLEQFRSPDGGYGPGPAGDTGSAYACFLALGTYQDLGAPCPRPEDIARCIEGLAVPSGGYANHRFLPVAATASTAAAVLVLKHLERPVAPGTAEWLFAQWTQEGGFAAAPGAARPDLLATATALHALAGIDCSPADIRRRCIDFVMSLRTPDGGFCACVDDGTADCEYTYYALLALGHLCGE